MKVRRIIVFGGEGKEGDAISFCLFCLFVGRWKGMKCALKGLHPSLVNQPKRLAGFYFFFSLFIY